MRHAIPSLLSMVGLLNGFAIGTAPRLPAILSANTSATFRTDTPRCVAELSAGSAPARKRVMYTAGGAGRFRDASMAATSVAVPQETRCSPNGRGGACPLGPVATNAAKAYRHPACGRMYQNATSTWFGRDPRASRAPELATHRYTHARRAAPATRSSAACFVSGGHKCTCKNN